MGVAVILMLLEMIPACPAVGWVTSDYGRRRHPISGLMRFHYGVDVANVRGTPVRSPWHATVLRVARSRHAGLHVVLRSGPYRVTMAHLSRAYVQEGAELRKGALVGLMGRSGRATGPHLHLSMRRGRRPVNPTVALATCPEMP